MVDGGRRMVDDRRRTVNILVFIFSKQKKVCEIKTKIFTVYRLPSAFYRPPSTVYRSPL